MRRIYAFLAALMLIPPLNACLPQEPWHTFSLLDEVTELVNASTAIHLTEHLHAQTNFTVAEPLNKKSRRNNSEYLKKVGKLRSLAVDFTNYVNQDALRIQMQAALDDLKQEPHVLDLPATLVETELSLCLKGKEHRLSLIGNQLAAHITALARLYQQDFSNLGFNLEKKEQIKKKLKNFVNLHLKELVCLANIYRSKKSCKDAYDVLYYKGEAFNVLMKDYLYQSVGNHLALLNEIRKTIVAEMLMLSKDERDLFSGLTQKETSLFDYMVNPKFEEDLKRMTAEMCSIQPNSKYSFHLSKNISLHDFYRGTCLNTHEFDDCSKIKSYIENYPAFQDLVLFMEGYNPNHNINIEEKTIRRKLYAISILRKLIWLM